MFSVYSWLRKLLFTLPPELAHSWTLKALSLYPFQIASATDKAPSFELLGMHFPNRIGLAAGLDKNGQYIDGLAKLGFGFIEVGTVTPKAQLGNPKPRLFRLAKDDAIINRMGFNNLGVDNLVHNLKQTRYKGVLGINIGKNRVTPVNHAALDYLYCLERCYKHASYITVNVSSPNTPGLRELQFGEALESLFKKLRQKQLTLADNHKKQVPLFAKLSPDMSSEALKTTVNTLVEQEIDGFVFSNTSCDKSSINSSRFAAEDGGMSGAPLMQRSTELLNLIRKQTDKPIIGVGGVMNAADARDKVEAGADLIQIYTGLIYKGPSLIKAINLELSNKNRGPFNETR